MAKAKSNFSADVIKKNLFWFFVPLAILLVWGIFFVANSKAKAAYNARMTELDNMKKATETAASNPKQPNEGTIADAKEKTNQLRGIVLEAWKELYEVQKEIRVWSDKLNPEFTNQVENLKWLSPIPGVKYREWYDTFISEQVPEFLVKAERRTVYVRVEDPNNRGKTPTVWMKNPDGSDRYFPLDPYVANPDEMLQQNAIVASSGGGMGSMGGMGGSGMSMGGMGGGGMGGGAGGSTFQSFAGGGAGGGMGGASGGMSGGGMPGGGGSEMRGYADMASGVGGVGSSLESIFEPLNQKVEGIVDWPNPEIFTIVTWPATPYSCQIWYAQEEVWVYDSLIGVVRNINKQVNATGPHNAAIKRIQAMLIGKNAANIAGSPGLLEPLGSFSGAGGMGMGMGMDMMGGGMSGGMGGPGGMSGGGMSGGDMSSSGMGGSGGMMGPGMDGMGMSAGPMNEESTMSYLVQYRYVGEDLKPLADMSSAPFKEFNMMPVCLELIVDQRKIPDIFVECANSTMPIDIKLVRYNPANARTGLITSSMGGGMGGMDGGMSGGMSGGMGGPSGMSGGGMGGGGSTSRGTGSGRGGAMSGAGGTGGPGGMGSDGGMGAAAEQLSGFEVGGKFGTYGSDAVMIQVVGVIYLYNEPDPSLYEEPEEEIDAASLENSMDGGINTDSTSLTPVVSPDDSTSNPSSLTPNP